MGILGLIVRLICSFYIKGLSKIEKCEVLESFWIYFYVFVRLKIFFFLRCKRFVFWDLFLIIFNFFLVIIGSSSEGKGICGDEYFFRVVCVRFKVDLGFIEIRLIKKSFLR